MEEDIREEPIVIAQYIRKSNPRFRLEREYLDSSRDFTKRLQPSEAFEKTSIPTKCSISTQTEEDNVPSDGTLNFYPNPNSRASSTGSLHGSPLLSSSNCSRKNFNEPSNSGIPLKRAATVIDIGEFDELISVDEGVNCRLGREHAPGAKPACIPLRYIQNYEAGQPKYSVGCESLRFDALQKNQPHSEIRVPKSLGNDAYSNPNENQVTGCSTFNRTNQNPYPISEREDISFPVQSELRNMHNVQPTRSDISLFQTEQNSGAAYFSGRGTNRSDSSRSFHDKSTPFFRNDRISNELNSKGRYCFNTIQPASDLFEVGRSDNKSLVFSVLEEPDDLHHAQMLHLRRQLSMEGKNFNSDSMQDYKIRRQHNDDLNVNSEVMGRHSFSNVLRVPSLKHQANGEPRLSQQNIYYLEPENLHPIQRRQNEYDRLNHKHSRPMTDRIQTNYQATSPDFGRQMSERETMIDITGSQFQKFAPAHCSRTRLSEKDFVQQLTNDVQNAERVLPKHFQRSPDESRHNLRSGDIYVSRPASFLRRPQPREQTTRRVYVLQRREPINATHREQLSGFTCSPERGMHDEVHIPEPVEMFDVASNPVVKQVSVPRQAPRKSYSFVQEDVVMAEEPVLMNGSVPVNARAPEMLLSKNFPPPERFQPHEVDSNEFQRNSVLTQQVLRSGSSCSNTQASVRGVSNVGATREGENCPYFPQVASRINDRASMRTEIPDLSFSSGNDPHSSRLGRTASAFNSFRERKVEMSPPVSNENYRAFLQTPDTSKHTANFHSRENSDAAAQNYVATHAPQLHRDEKFDETPQPSRNNHNASFFDPTAKPTNTGAALRKNLDAPLLQRALEEPRVSLGRDNLLPTVLADISVSDNSSSQSKPDSRRPESQASLQSDGGDDWTDDDELETGRTLKRIQHCTFCRNHGLSVRKFGHVCERKTCECLLCKLTLHCQVIMKQQQALWRRQTKEFKGSQLRSSKKEKLCDKCRNHNEVSEKRGHASACRYELCRCDACKLTNKRRRVTKYLQRIRRAKVTSEEMDKIWKEMNEENPDSTSSQQSECQDRSRGRPIQQFVSCLVPDSMSQNEIRHFLYPRPHLADTRTDTDLADGAPGNLVSRVEPHTIGDSAVEEVSPIQPDEIDFSRDQSDGEKSAYSENSTMNSSFKKLCMAEKKKIVEGKSGNLREFLNYGESLREYGAGVASTECSVKLTLGDDESTSETREAPTQRKEPISTSRLSEINYNRSEIKEEWPERDEDMDNMMDMVEEELSSMFDDEVGPEQERPVVKNAEKLMIPKRQYHGPNEGKSSGQRIFTKLKKQKRTQSCTFCQNHGFTVPKPGHRCPYSQCECLLCRLTKLARIVMKHQQALWRHQARELKKTTLGSPTKLRQVCDKCRNHNLLHKKSGHTSCAFETCTCPLCTLTDKRRQVMMHLQRIRRAQITAKAISSSEDESESQKTSNRDPASESRKLHREEANDSVSKVIENITEALKALPPSLRKLSSKFDIADEEHEAEEQDEAEGGSSRALAGHDKMEVVEVNPKEDHPLETEELNTDSFTPTLTQL